LLTGGPNFADCFFDYGSVAGIAHDEAKANLGHPHNDRAAEQTR